MSGCSTFCIALVSAAALPAAVIWASADRVAVHQGGTRTTSAPSPMSWGAPNLEGLWTSGPMIDVPFERAPKLGTRAVLTDEEFLGREAENRAQIEADRLGVIPGATVGVGVPAFFDRGKPSRQASLIVDPPDGRLPALTEDGARRARRWRDTADRPAGPEELNPYDRCITRGVLGSIFPNTYNSAARIIQTPASVTIHHEMIHETRLIPLDGRPHLPQGIGLYMGDSRGHWEDQSLVVETTNFNGTTGSYGRNGNGNPTSRSLRLVERFTVTDPNTLQYEVRVEDPLTFTRPWTVAFPLTRDPTYTMYEYACHEGNYALVNILKAARATEGPVP